MPTAGWWEALRPNPADVFARVGVKPGMEIIDLCSGHGWFTQQIAKVARRVVAIDIDSALLQVARLRLAEGGLTNCDFIAGDAYELATLVHSPNDVVFFANAFHDIQDRPRLTQSVAAVLKPGGLFAIVNWHQRPREQTTILGEPRGLRTELRIGPKATKAAVESDVLQISRLVELPPYHCGAIF